MGLREASRDEYLASMAVYALSRSFIIDTAASRPKLSRLSSLADFPRANIKSRRPDERATLSTSEPLAHGFIGVVPFGLPIIHLRHVLQQSRCDRIIDLQLTAESPIF